MTKVKFSTESSISVLIGDVMNQSPISSTDLPRYIRMRLIQMRLSRNGQEKTFNLTQIAWQTTLHIAVAYGWKPLGTVNDRSADWDGSYLSDYDQTVTCDDAINLAGALRRSIADKFRKLRGTELEFVFKQRKGSAIFLRELISFVTPGNFDIGGIPDEEVYPDGICLTFKTPSGTSVAYINHQSHCHLDTDSDSQSTA